jgi:lipopolysaccharide export system protein LptC
MFQRVCMTNPVSILSVIAVLAATGCGGPAQAPGPVPPELRLDGVAFRFYRADSLHAFGLAETASLQRDSEVLRARNVIATLPQGGEPVRITAPTGEGSLQARTFEATGGLVVARGADVARTDTARFEPEGQGGVVRGDDPVTVSGKGYRLTGSGFTLDPGAGTIVVGGGARLVTGPGVGE